MENNFQKVHVYQNSETESHCSNETLLGVQGFLKEGIYVVAAPDIFESIDILEVTTEGGFEPEDQIILKKFREEDKYKIFVKSEKYADKKNTYIYKKMR